MLKNKWYLICPSDELKNEIKEKNFRRRYNSLPES